MSADRTEWRGRVFFHDVAEAIGIPSDLVLALRGGKDGTLFALYTTEADETLIRSVLLRYDRDGILRVATVPREHPGLWEEIKRGADARIRDELEKRRTE